MTASWIEVKNGKWNLHSEVVGFQLVSGDDSRWNLGQYIVGLCYAPWTILLSHTILYLYSLTMCTTGPFLLDYDFLYWTYMLSRYLAAISCSLTFLIRITFARHHCLIPWLTSILYPAHVSHFCSNTYDFFTAYCTYDCASVSTLLRCCADSLCLCVPILYNDSYLNCFT